MEKAQEECVVIEIHTDSKDLVDASHSLLYTRSMHKRRRTDVFDLQDLQSLGKLLPLRKIVGDTNPADAGTKRQSFESMPYTRLRLLLTGWYSGDYRW